jgi:methylated-DNA-[protein]-cysteine S-methyltransferase
VPACWTVIDSPVGPLGLEADDDALTRVVFHAAAPASTASREPLAPVIAEASRQLAAYFAGDLTVFSVRLAPRGTPFQQEVWAALQRIPYGDSRSYRQLAESIGRPAAIRAVGAANGANPIPIFIPCHRVIGSDGRLVGFGGGLTMKRTLLDLEQGHLHLGGPGGF